MKEYHILGLNRPLSHSRQFESQESKKLCFCPSSLALDERLDGQNLLFQHCMIKIYLDSSPSSSLIFTLTSGNLFYSRKKGDLHKQSTNKKADYYLLCESENTRSILGKLLSCGRHGGLMVSALVSGSSVPGSSPGGIVSCSWARHLTLTVPLSTQVYKWVLANLILGRNPAMD